MGVFPGVWWALALAAALVGPVAYADQPEIQFDEFTLKATYISENHFDMRAMGSVYNASPYIIDFIANKQAYPEGFVSVSDGFVELAPPAQQWRPLLAHYAGPAALLAAALLLAALLPLLGVVWVCCAWCRSGRRRRPFDRKYDACLKGLLAILLIALLTLFLFGVVCAFATEQQLEEGAARAGGAARAAGRDLVAYLNHTHAHAHHLLVHNYRTLRQHVDAQLAGGGEVIARALVAEAGLGALEQLARLVAQLPALKQDLDRLHSGTALLRYHAEHLNSGLRKVKGKLLHTLANCDQPQCKRLQEKYRINQLDTEIHYSQELDKYFPTIPDVTPLLSNLSALAQSGVQADVARAQRALRDLPALLQHPLTQRTPAAAQALDQTEAELQKLSAEIGLQAERGAEAVEQWVFPASEQLDALHAARGPWRRLVALAAALVALLITFLLSMGVACGVCGARPDAYGAASCCHKGAGAACLVGGTSVIFLLGGVMSLVMAIYFLLGITAQRFVCDPLNKPEGNRLFADVEQLVDLEGLVFDSHQDPSYTLQAVMQRCHNNYTVYVALGLERKYNLSALGVAAEAQAAGALAAAAASVALPPRAALLPPAAADNLRALAHSGLAEFRYQAVLDALSSSAVSLAPGELSAQLAGAARALEARAAPPAAAPAAAAALRDAAALLAALQRDRADPLQRQIHELNTTANNIRERLQLDTASLQATVLELLQQCQQAEEYLNTQGNQRVLNLTQEWASGLAEAVGQFAAAVQRGARQDVGRCEPVSRAYNHTRDHLCRNVLLPLNGFWISIAWCILLFVPLTLVARRLACLYRTREPYPGPLVEAEYLYDAYADRDNVPLANAYKAEKRRGRGGGAGGGAGGAGAGGAGGAGRAGGAAPPPLVAQHARRYHDMAPKHWEEGPPRYHGPAEYERPPPYYFPPPADRQ